MTYQEWHNSHKAKRDTITHQQANLSVAELVEYFNYDHMIIAEPDFCRLYLTNTKCHEMANLNCYNCGCPYFKFDDNGLTEQDGVTVYSTCTINAVSGSQFISETAIHHDCSNCTIPHEAKFAKRELIKQRKIK